MEMGTFTVLPTSRRRKKIQEALRPMNHRAPAINLTDNKYYLYLEYSQV